MRLIISSVQVLRLHTAHNVGSNKDVDLYGSRYQLNDDGEREPEIGKCEPRKDEIEKVVLLVSSLSPTEGTGGASLQEPGYVGRTS